VNASVFDELLFVDASCVTRFVPQRRCLLHLLYLARRYDPLGTLREVGKQDG
jgi:hypothetical protein